MNKYESVVIINPTVDEVDELGKRKLAYDVKKFSEGFYAVFYFEANSDLIAELERNYRITDEIIKFMTVKKD